MYIMCLGIIIVNVFINSLKISKNFRTYLYLVVFLMLTLLLSLRDGIGVDYYTYVDIFNQVPVINEWVPYNRISENFDQEVGYLIINSLVKTIGLEHKVMFSIFSLISMSFIFLNITRYTKYIFLAVSLYYVRFFFLRDMGQIRASIAIGLLLFGLKYINGRDRKEKVKYFFWIVLASAFHISTLLGIPMYFIHKFIGKSNKRGLFIFIISFIIGILPIRTFLIWGLSFFIPIAYLGNYYGYASGISNPVLISQMLILFIYICAKNKICHRQKFYYEIRNCYFISTCILLAFNQFAVIAGRLSTVYATLEIFIIPSFIYILRNKFLANFIIVFYIVLMFYVNVILKLGNSEWYFPYKSFLF